MKKNKTLRRSLLRMISLFWVIPLLIVMLIMSFTVSKRLEREMARTMQTTMENAAEIVNLRLDDCIAQSKEISYNNRLRDIYNAYRQDGNDADLYASVTTLLEEKYKFNSDFMMTGLWFTDAPDKVYLTGGNHLSSCEKYWKQNVQTDMQKLSDEIETRTTLMHSGSHVYLVRNVVDRSFHPYAVIFMDLDSSRIFASLKAVWQYQMCSIYYDGRSLITLGPTYENADTSAFILDGQVHSYDYDQIYISRELAGSQMVFLVTYDADALKAERRAPALLFLVAVCLLVPLLILLFYFLRSRVVHPLEELAMFSREISKGHFGVQVPVHAETAEIAAVDENFNEASRQLKKQFNKIYTEEIALRDANIHALQSQINPHFLNNTLEIINWEARMGENEKVSNMIEALSTMMSATTDRQKRPQIPLEEELSYVDAYLYIIQCRYGDDFTCEKNVQTGCEGYMVPRLIIQPVIENAVEHARDENGKGSVVLEITGGQNPKDSLRIVIRNKGVPSEEDMQKIKALLSDDETELHHASHIGIRNVNKRLKYMYGEESGLSIGVENGETVSTILIKK